MKLSGDDLRTFFRVGFDDLTVARLLELADVCQCDPATVIYSLVHDILEDDARAHESAAEAVGATLQ